LGRNQHRDTGAALPSSEECKQMAELFPHEVDEAILGSWADHRVTLERLEKPLPVGSDEQRRSLFVNRGTDERHLLFGDPRAHDDHPGGADDTTYGCNILD
jgi:hypothetical protein